ncbi:uncharacterized protein LOC127748753 [Frankliniella occidentalis]|uniref:Uncharacterized protein LOC127748753 n=1 Tax=Frankliniella occidentalis TaxID=133901 RepID=A0A9C6TSV6_FRAOC|nr:uncharacterized protein LOC127748753 [Frankliniella occidentalis]XP_052119499.1 uncharacterized protein LOC127748753 [Frankliniella occidentalis]
MPSKQKTSRLNTTMTLHPPTASARRAVLRFWSYQREKNVPYKRHEESNLEPFHGVDKACGDGGPGGQRRAVQLQHHDAEHPEGPPAASAIGSLSRSSRSDLSQGCSVYREGKGVIINAPPEMSYSPTRCKFDARWRGGGGVIRRQQ